MTDFMLPPSDDHPLAAAIREGIGASDDEPVEVVTRPHLREPNEPPPSAPPADADAWDALMATTDTIALRERGLRPWGGFRMEAGAWVEAGDPDDDPGEPTHMLWVLPGEWYSSIPAGTRVHTIFCREEEFIPGVTDNGTGLGMLPYGLLLEIQPKEAPPADSHG